MQKTLFLNPPSFDGFDGGAGSRYQARREVRSFWFPTWLAQPAAMVPGSKLVDAPPADLSREQVVPMAGEFELCFIHTSTPSFWADVKTAEAMKEHNPRLTIGFVGPHVAVLPEEALRASKAIDFVTRLEFDWTCVEVAEGRPFEQIDGLSYRAASGEIVHNRDRALTDMDTLPWVVDVYKRDLRIDNYEIGEALYPFVSFYGGRGCRSKCTFCLWPYTVGGHKYRVRSPENVVGEVERATEYFPQIREVFFDDDTMTDARPWVEDVARKLGPVLVPKGITWSTNAKVNVPLETLKVLKANGLRLFTVGFESGSQEILNNVKKGMTVKGAREFAENCHRLGIKMHGTFIVGLPGETKETIRDTVQFAKEINPHTLQVSLAAPFPGTYLYDQAKREGWLRADHGKLVGIEGFQVSTIEYPHLSAEDIFAAQEQFYREYFFRPSKIAEIMWEMLKSPPVLRRRLREGLEFLGYLRHRENRPASGTEARPAVQPG
jgi:hopanoid biosynthesis associated radical SAM protein HpnJ